MHILIVAPSCSRYLHCYRQFSFLTDEFLRDDLENEQLPTGKVNFRSLYHFQ